MDLVTSCKDKLAYFRIKELKDVLTQLGLSKQGRKQDLVDRILSALSDEQASKMWAKKNVGKEDVAKLVDDIYRKMQVSGATDLASNGQGTSDCSNIKIKAEFDDPYRSETKVRCPCGGALETEPMIKCEDPRCHVWQHMSCVLLPEKPGEGNPMVPEIFYCELCRLSRADPFWVSVAHPLNPVKMTTTNIPTDGGNPVQSVEKTFQLTRADKDLLSKQEYDVQAWCMLLNDKVPFRMHWPQYADLQVNGMPVRAITRSGSQLLGANGRDDGPIVTTCTKDGINEISLMACDARIFCLGVRLVERRSVQQILNLIPKESDGERFEDAVARVSRCVGGGGATKADSGSDLEVVADSFVVNLRCPVSHLRITVAGRFKPCAHIGCFDLVVFVEMNQRSRKWQCPSCSKNYSLENIIIDPFFNRVTSLMRSCGKGVVEIEIKPGGGWRVKAKTESEWRDLGDLIQWHRPDGTLCLSAEDNTPLNAEYMKQIRQEGVSGGHTGLKFRMRKNRDGYWEVCKPDELDNSSTSRLADSSDSFERHVNQLSSSATGSGSDVEEKDSGEEEDSDEEKDSLASPGSSSSATGSGSDGEEKDSDEEKDNLVSRSPSLIDLSLFDTGISDSCDSSEGPAVGTEDCQNLDLCLAQEGPSFQTIGPVGDVSDALADLHHGSMEGTPSANGYALAPVNLTESTAVDPDPSVVFDDPSLQSPLLTRPSALSNALPTKDDDFTLGLDEDDLLSLGLGEDEDDLLSLGHKSLGLEEDVYDRHYEMLMYANFGHLYELPTGRSEVCF